MIFPAALLLTQTSGMLRKP